MPAAPDRLQPGQSAICGENAGGTIRPARPLARPAVRATRVCMWVTQSGHLSTPPPPQADAEKGEDGASNGRLGRLADEGRERHLPAPKQGAPALIRMRRASGRSHWPQSESIRPASRHPVSAEPRQSESAHCESSKAMAPGALLSGRLGSPSPNPPFAAGSCG